MSRLKLYFFTYHNRGVPVWIPKGTDFIAHIPSNCWFFRWNHCKPTTVLWGNATSELPVPVLVHTVRKERQKKRQAQIHTNFHYFTEISHTFHNKYIFFNNKKHFPSWNPVWMTWKPWKGDWRSKNPKTFLREPASQTPLEACAFGACLGNQ